RASDINWLIYELILNSMLMDINEWICTWCGLQAGITVVFLNKRIPARLLFLLSGLISIGVFANQHSDTTVRLATLGEGVGNFAPVLYVENSRVKGTMPEQIRCAFAALHMETQFVTVPIGRHIWAVDKHRADGYFPATAYEDNTSPQQTSIVLLESEIAVYS